MWKISPTTFLTYQYWVQIEQLIFWSTKIAVKANTMKSEERVWKCTTSKVLTACRASQTKDFLNSLINKLRIATTANLLKRIRINCSYKVNWKMKIVDRLLIYQTIRSEVSSADPFQILISMRNSILFNLSKKRICSLLIKGFFWTNLRLFMRLLNRKIKMSSLWWINRFSFSLPWILLKSNINHLLFKMTKINETKKCKLIKYFTATSQSKRKNH